MTKLNNMLKLFVVAMVTQFAFADPGWDPAGECFLTFCATSKKKTNYSILLYWVYIQVCESKRYADLKQQK